MVRFYDGRLALLLEPSDGDGAAARLLGAGRVGAHFFWAVSGAALLYVRACRCTGAAPRVRGAASNAPSVG